MEKTLETKIQQSDPINSKINMHLYPNYYCLTDSTRNLLYTKVIQKFSII